jgi:hypothetical protein
MLTFLFKIKFFVMLWYRRKTALLYCSLAWKNFSTWERENTAEIVHLENTAEILGSN